MSRKNDTATRTRTEERRFQQQYAQRLQHDPQRSDRSSAPQLNHVREAYHDGDLNEAQLEQQVEHALTAGPPIGQDTTVKPPTGWDAATSAIAGVCLTPLLWFVSWKQDSTGEISYDWPQHMIRVVDHDPDPGDHPAESAGTVQALCWVWPVMLTMAATMTAFNAGSGALGVLFAAVYAAVAKAPRPAVEVVDRGLGRHVARAGTATEGDS